MDRLTVELSALAFQAVMTALFAGVYFRLWERQKTTYFLTWGVAWSLYAMRLGFISAFLLTRDMVWLYLHQVVTGFSALLLLFAAFQFSRGVRWRWRYAWLGVLSAAWAYNAIFVMHDMMVAGITASVLLTGVTAWTAIIFWRFWARVRSGGALVLAWTFTLWGLHHLDYPLLRPLGTGVLLGVFIDIVLIMLATLGSMFLVLGQGRRMLEARSHQLEQLTRQLLRAQEDERRRISRELHDEAGQILTAVKIELDLDGRKEASAMVARALAQVRDLSNLLRPSALDDLGLVPAVRGLVEDFTRRTQVRVTLDMDERLRAPGPDVQVVIYRVIQEALTNVARHADARAVAVRVTNGDGQVNLHIEDDGRGFESEPTPHLGLLGMRERVAELGGTLHIEGAPGRGVRLDVILPVAGAA
jgi:signal transduction histidine kinase